MKILLKILVGLVVLVVILVVAGALALGALADSAAKNVVERGGTYALGVNTTLDNADVGLMSGEFSMQGLNVSNPEGFQDHFLKLGTGYVSIDYNTLQQDVIELPTLTLTSVDMQLLKNAEGSNYKIILENLKRFESGEKKPEAEPAKKLVIRKVEIKDVKVNMQLTPVGGNLTQVPVEVDLIELNDVGSGGKPIAPADVIGIVVKAVIGAAIAKAGDLPADLQGMVEDLQVDLSSLESLGDQGVQVMMEVGGQLEDVTGQLGGTIEGLGEGAGKAAEEAGKAIEDIGKGVEEVLKNPFQKKDEKKDDGNGG